MSQDEIYDEFEQRVNMSPRELERWLESDESHSVGQSKNSGESVDHESGRRIVAIRRTKKADLDDDDYDHMRKVNGYIARHVEQGQPKKEDTETSPWRYSLMNWGHDPLKD